MHQIGGQKLKNQDKRMLTFMLGLPVGNPKELFLLEFNFTFIIDRNLIHGKLLKL